MNSPILISRYKDGGFKPILSGKRRITAIAKKKRLKNWFMSELLVLFPQ